MNRMLIALQASFQCTDFPILNLVPTRQNNAPT